MKPSLTGLRSFSKCILVILRPSHIVHPLLSAGGLNLPPNFQKGVGLLGRVAGKEEVNLGIAGAGAIAVFT